MCLSLTLDYHYNQHSFWKKHDLKKDFYLAICYFPSFPFMLDHKASRRDRSLTVSALGRVELVKVMAISGVTATVLLTHPSECRRCASPWGRGGAAGVIAGV